MIIQTFSPDMFSKAIQDDSAAIGALMAIYAFQTQDEKEVRSTKYQNGVGFNGTDSTFCSSLCQQYRSKGRLTEKQLAAVKKLLPKYWKQVPEISPLPNGPSPAEVNSKDTVANLPFAELIRREGIVELTFPYDPEKVIRVKTLSGRKWGKENKKWTVPVSLFVTDALKEMGFGIGRKLSRWINDESVRKNKESKIKLDFSLCPLYNNRFRKEPIIIQEEEDYANGSLSENEKTTGNYGEKLCKRKGTCSKGKSKENIRENSTNSRMEGKSITKNKKSNENTGNSRETSERIEEVDRNKWSEFSGREWPEYDTNGKISKQTILQMWVHKGIPDKYSTSKEYVQKCFQCLQSRLCQSNNQNSNRDGWAFSLSENKGEGREKNRDSSSPWVDCHTFAALVSIKTIPELKWGLRRYQLEDVFDIDERNGRVIIGSEMGVGKTIQALGWLQLRKKDVLPALVVCPASLKLNWAREALKFTDLEPVIINGKNDKKFTIIPGGNRKDIYIANYDIIHEAYECPACEGKKKINGEKCPTCKGKGKIPRLDKTIKDLGVKTVIYDEAHYLKSDTSSRTIAAKELSSSCSHVIPLSGTPIVNRPIEFYSTINMVNPKLFTSWWQYTQRFCGRKRTPFGWDVNGATNKEELHKILSQTIMIRRLKKDVLKDLPPKVRVVVPLEIDLGKYNQILERIAAELEGQEAEHLTIIEKAKQLIASLKMDMALEWIENYIESGEKLVVFGEHSKILEQVQEKFKNNSVLVYGGTSQTGRQAAVDKFQNDPDCKVFIGSKSAMEGLTLTAAHATAFLELWWVPAHHDQAEDRVHRIGQEADSVTAYYLLAAGTIEEDIVEMLDAKRQVVTAILDGKKVEDVNMISMLLKKITGKEI